MPRRPRRACWTDAACYHVMNRGQNRASIFADDNDRQYFLALLARYSQRFDIRLYHYCLMSNHFHLLLQLAQPRQLSRLMASMLVAYVRYFQRRYRFVGQRVSRPIQEPGDRSGALLAELRPLHRAQSGRSEPGAGRLAVPLVELPRPCPGCER